jgi:excisionase family DNA binding protein
LEAAQRLNVPLHTVQSWIDDGQLETVKVEGGHRQVSITSLEHFRGTALAIQQQESLRSSSLKILIVEDNGILQRLYTSVIGQWRLPIEVFVASTGYEGLLLVGKEEPSLLITDLMMPGLDGFALVRTLMGSEFCRDMKIIVVTGLEEDEIVEKGGLPPEVQIFGKPVPFGDLRAICEELLEQRALAVSLAA